MAKALNQSNQSARVALGQRTSVLIVEDDQTTRHLVASYLEEHDIRTMLASRRAEAVRLLARDEPSLVILDLQLGETNGFDLLREIRSRSDIPVIITTGHRCDEMDRVFGLDLGADDYVTKPFSLRELLARIRAVLRWRETRKAASLRTSKRGRCRFGGWQLDRRIRRVTDSSGAPVVLSRSVYALLIAFLDAPQQPLSREYLLQAIRVHGDVSDRSIDTQVLRLRRKLEVDPSAPRVILTERGVGYLFALPVERLS